MHYSCSEESVDFIFKDVAHIFSVCKNILTAFISISIFIVSLWIACDETEKTRPLRKFLL